MGGGVSIEHDASTLLTKTPAEIASMMMPTYYDTSESNPEDFACVNESWKAIIDNLAVKTKYCIRCNLLLFLIDALIFAFSLDIKKIKKTPNSLLARLRLCSMKVSTSECSRLCR